MNGVGRQITARCTLALRNVINDARMQVGGMPSNMALYTTQDGDTSNGFQKGNSISVPNVPTGDVSAEGAPGVEMY